MNHHVKLVFFTLLFVLTCVARADEADDFIKAEMERQKIPGLALAVVREGNVAKAQGYGLADVENEVPVTPETVFKIASLSKQFIAAGIMLLANDGKLSVDDRVSRHLEGTPETWKDITIRHLLTHTSGLVREAPAYDRFKVQHDAAVIQSAYPLPLEFPTGEKYQYCNVGYFALAVIIQRVSGLSWEDFLNTRIFAPLNMSATKATNVSRIVPRRAHGYEHIGPVLVHASDNIAVRPSGAFLSTVLDLAKWDAALYTDKPLPQAALAQMWTPVRLNSGATHPYGFGWKLEFDSRRQIHHSGSLGGFRSHFSRFPEDKLSFIVLTNCGTANPEKIVQGLAKIYLPDKAPDGAKPPTSSVPASP
jgi:D-alanyl-D-alanine carboxypeptidase